MTTASYLISCPSCGAGNRIPADKEGLHGRCGNCKSALPPLYCHPQQMTDRTLDSFVSSYPGPVLVEFWAPTCSHCHAFAPVVRTLAERLAGRAAIVQINIQENPNLAARFDISGVPVLLLFKRGRVIDQLTGAQTLDAVLAWFRRKM